MIVSERDGAPFASFGTAVVADHERRRGLAGDGQVELLGRRLDVDAVRRDSGDRLVHVEVCAARRRR